DLLKDLLGASWMPRQFKDVEEPDADKQLKTLKAEDKNASTRHDMESLRLFLAHDRMVDAYRRYGHLAAKIDPLRLATPPNHPLLNPSTLGLSSDDLQKRSTPNGEFYGNSGSLEEVLSSLKACYTGTIGAEFEHITDLTERMWLRDRFESRQMSLTLDAKKRVFESLVAAESFERFLQVKFPSAKRFGLEGGESMIAGIDAIVFRAATSGIKEITFGMAHRGRLNLIVNVIKHHARRLLAEFQGNHGDHQTQIGSGDVKYHLGVSSDQQINGADIHLSLMPNPSHLEFVNPVVSGKVRGRQTLQGDETRKSMLGVVIHGDAAFAGQGVVAETLLLSNLAGYTTGGTIHIIINNQVGFTASPGMLKSSTYCSDLAKTIEAPIFHVNGDDPEAVVWLSELALEYRQTFQKDFFIDLVCYRRNGHNEMDEPAFTQPVMYQTIRQHPSTLVQYREVLAQSGIDASWLDQVQASYDDHMKAEMDASSTFEFGEPDWLKSSWQGIDYRHDDQQPMTGISSSVLKKIGEAIAREPEGFALNGKIQRLINDRRDMLLKTEMVDWAVGEALAFGSLLHEGYPVRLSGQDCKRGTFTQRHAVYTDQNSNATFTPLHTIESGQALFEVLNSPLSETAVLGFELGYSYADPKSLVIWEAQFGDFSNGAQVIIDQFICAGEAKWHRLTGLVMMLPHSFDGQGPEHSSARLERYLQLCAEDNMRVANCSTPANLFHLLRRQIHSRTRKPLIIMTPKALLRHKRVISSLSDFGSGTHFYPVIDEIDQNIKAQNVKRVIVCSGKVYYDLLEKRETLGVFDVALLRLEQFYPFPREELRSVLKAYKNAEVVWCQEEPENMGAWHFVDRRLEGVLIELSMNTTRPRYLGRPASASPATGFAEQHQHEQDDLVQQALTL
ncbi:MAG: 2-oxoglutarate dehydrogenase E1 component, partial [Alphaproteobacteria bacterium]|nr:2-oxoglutarate dehydrogenase E1 component [Alphaproteobacteria bacterium]